jgi:hypothetical protein
VHTYLAAPCATSGHCSGAWKGAAPQAAHAVAASYARRRSAAPFLCGIAGFGFAALVLVLAAGLGAFGLAGGGFASTSGLIRCSGWPWIFAMSPRR